MLKYMSFVFVYLISLIACLIHMIKPTQSAINRRPA